MIEITHSLEFFENTSVDIATLGSEETFDILATLDSEKTFGVWNSKATTCWIFFSCFFVLFGGGEGEVFLFFFILIDSDGEKFEGSRISRPTREEEDFEG